MMELVRNIGAHELPPVDDKFEIQIFFLVEPSPLNLIVVNNISSIFYF